ncbi:MAG: POTRA domain-containing protein [Rhodospirillaceae bacterium]
MTLGLRKWLPAMLAVFALVACAETKTPAGNHTAAAPKGPTDCLPRSDRYVCIQPDNIVFPIGDDSAQEVDHIDFSGNDFYPRNQLLKSILSQEFHWYRYLSADYVSFRGPFQSRALLEPKGCVAEEDFGFVDQPPCFRGSPWGARDFVRFDDVILSKEHVFNADRVAADSYLLSELYRAQGYVDAHVKPASSEPANGMVTLSYAVSQGERYRFGRIGMSTNIAGYNPEDMRYAVDVREGEWFDPIQLDEIVKRLNQVKMSSGPLFRALGGHLPHGNLVTIDYKTMPDRAKRIVDVTIVVRGTSTTMASAAAKPVKAAGPKPPRAAQVRPVPAHSRVAAVRPARPINLASAAETGIY